MWQSKDDGRIVVDELAGMLIAMVWIPFSWPSAVLAFLLFRAFDIVKPWPCRQLQDRMPGGYGVMLDDVAAGIWVLILMHGLGLFGLLP